MIQAMDGPRAVVSSKIIFARCPTVPEAIRAAVQLVVNEPGKGRTVIRGSTRDGFSRA